MKDELKSVVKGALVSTTAIILAAALTDGTLQAREWQAWDAAEGPNPSSQALAFLPNELWIHTNDSIRCEPDNKGLNAFRPREPALQSNNVFRAYRYSEEEVVRAR